MKKLKILLLLLFFSLAAAGQKNADFGVTGGITSYLGDINTNRLFYKPSPAGGLFYRYNFHPRNAIRLNILIGGLKANDLDFNNNFQISREGLFSGIIGEWALQYEFNFFPYSTQGKRWNYTPYFAAGIGITFLDINASHIANSAIVQSDILTYEPVIPFSIGFKINIHKNLGLEAEYGFRKTFYDNFDGLKDNVHPSHYAWLHNNDWYSFAGISFTWKIYDRLAGCPAYKDVDVTRKR